MNAPLADEERTVLREVLEERRGTLRASIEKQRGVAREGRIGQYAGEVHDRGEESSVDAAAEVNDALIDQQEVELRAVRVALERIEEGRYGECVQCGGAIGLARLKAWPTAARCVSCQENSESGT